MAYKASLWDARLVVQYDLTSLFGQPLLFHLEWNSRFFLCEYETVVTENVSRYCATEKANVAFDVHVADRRR